MKTAISEIYASLQGEGPYTGEPQVFVRLAGCPLRCDYCDTPDSLTSKGHPVMTVSEVLDQVLALTQEKKIRTVSITGGEPLAHGTFLLEFLPHLKKEGLKVYLETAGVHPESLQSIILYVDIVSMDIKLPSATGKIFWKQHERFLEIAGEKVFIKIVLENHSTDDEIETALALLSHRRPVPRLILQPATSIGSDILPPTAERLDSIYERAKACLPEVFIMPQQHKIWSIR